MFTVSFPLSHRLSAAPLSCREPDLDPAFGSQGSSSCRPYIAMACRWKNRVHPPASGTWFPSTAAQRPDSRMYLGGRVMVVEERALHVHLNQSRIRLGCLWILPRPEGRKEPNTLCAFLNSAFCQGAQCLLKAASQHALPLEQS